MEDNTVLNWNLNTYTAWFIIIENISDTDDYARVALPVDGRAAATASSRDSCEEEDGGESLVDGVAAQADDAASIGSVEMV